MATRVLHLSDLHFGRNDKPESIEALGRLVEEARPELVIASGDLTHRGLRDAARAGGRVPARARACRCWRSPATTTSRTRSRSGSRSPWQEFERLWETTEPRLPLGRRSSSSGSTRCGRGATSPAGSATRSSSAPREAFAGRPRARSGSSPSTTTCSARPGARARSRSRKRNRVLAGLVEAGAELDPRRAHPPEHGRRAARVRALDARRASTPWSSRSRRGSASRGRTAAARRAACTSTRSATTALRILTYIWREDGWGLTAVRTFPRGREPLAFERSALEPSAPPAARGRRRRGRSEQDDRADDRGQPAADVPELVHRIGVESAAGEEAAEDRADDADDAS